MLSRLPIVKRNPVPRRVSRHSVETLAGIKVAMLQGFTEKRGSERFAIREAARIVWQQNPAGVDCVATNVSDGGAKLIVRVPELPDVFVLHFVASGKQRHCRVAWRAGSETGVAFTDRIQVNFGRRIAAPMS